ncbi:MAG TPA: hypothetical protein VK489_03240 [Ferruginibacter sp.]|nr:hypothetical protein [Ferruginibacter sp.]
MKTNLLISAVKNNLLLSSAVAAGGLALFYFMRRMRSGRSITDIPTQQHTRHLTNLFSKAKSMV